MSGYKDSKQQHSGIFSTPDISHLTTKDYDKVYEPAEDSFLFLDALQEEADFIQSIRPLICLEIGSGSGIVSTFLARFLPYQPLCLCTDINPAAALVTKRTGIQNGVRLEPMLTDLVAALLPRIRGQVDVLLFNPPYVVTPPEEVGSSGIEASWAGGHRGREVTDRLLPHVAELLSKNGVFYLVIIEENDSADISRILGRQGLLMSTVLRRRSGPEKLSILKFIRQCNHDVH